MRTRASGPKGWSRHGGFQTRATRAPGYNDLRRLHLADVRLLIRRAPGLPAAFRTPIETEWLFYEVDAHRDKDGVALGAIKLVLDALVLEGKIPTDTQAHVGRCRGYDVRPGAAAHGIVLTIHQPEVDRSVLPFSPYTAPGCVVHALRCGPACWLAVPRAIDILLPLRLPDANEWLQARELAGRRAERRRGL